MFWPSYTDARLAGFDDTFVQTGSVVGDFFPFFFLKKMVPGFTHILNLRFLENVEIGLGPVSDWWVIRALGAMGAWGTECTVRPEDIEDARKLMDSLGELIHEYLSRAEKAEDSIKNDR
jgi:hypothetical protein